MAVTIQCPNPECGVTSAVADSISGRSVKCKRCGTPFVAKPTMDGQSRDTGPNSGVPSGDPFPTLPAKFGRYEVQKKLGQGGMGAVYLAEDTELNRKVALKLPAFAAGESPQRIERFVREAKASAALQHPNICTVYDAGKLNGRPFISMAFIDGKPLEALIDPEQPMPPERAAELARKIAAGLAHAHAKGIVHRDLKPANIMVTADGDPIVMDFGLAKRLADVAQTDAESKLTQQGAIMGTPTYMAPEQVRGDIDEIRPTTDVYALGVILFEMLTGRTPYSGRIGVVMGQILHAPVPDVSEFRTGIDPRLADICKTAMAKDAASRFPDMAAFMARLDDYLKSLGMVSVSLLPQAITPTAVPISTVVAPPVTSPFGDLTDEEDDDQAEQPTRRSTSSTKSRSRKQQPASNWPWLVGAGLALFAAVLVAGVILLFRTKHGEVVVELSDPTAKVQVAVDGETVELTGLDRPLKLTAGEHGLTVTGSDFETVTQKFTVKRGEKEVVRVSLKPKAKSTEVAKVEPPKPKEPDPAAPMPSTPATTPPEQVVSPSKHKPMWINLASTQEEFDQGFENRWGQGTEVKFVNGVITPKGPVTYRFRTEFTNYVFRCRVFNTAPAFRPGDNAALSIGGTGAFWFNKNPDARKGGFGFGYNVNGKYRDTTTPQTITVSGINECEMAAAHVDGVLYLFVDRKLFAKTTPDLKVWNQVGVGGYGDFSNLQIMSLDDAGITPQEALTITDVAPAKKSDPPLAQIPSPPPPPMAARPLAPADAKALGRSSYKVFTDQLSWKQAKAKCEDLGGRLAIINSEEQNRFISGLFTDAGLNEAWIGFTDEAEEGKWVWVDGSAATYKNWFSNQPNNKPPGEHFALMWVGPKGELRDNMVWCDQPNVALQPHKPGFVCEWVCPPVAPAPQPKDDFKPLFNGQDLTGWKSYGKPTWEWKDGRLVGMPAPDKSAGLLMTEANYSDFELELEYKATPGMGSRLHLRTDPNSPIDSNEHLEIQIYDDALYRTPYDTGSVWNAFRRKVVPPIKSGDWNVLLVKLVGRKIDVWVNGTQTVDADLDDVRQRFAKQPGLARASGRIGLKQTMNVVEFRSLRVKDLSAKPNAAAPLPKAELVKFTGLVGEQAGYPLLTGGGNTLLWSSRKMQSPNSSYNIYKASRGQVTEPFGPPELIKRCDGFGMVVRCTDDLSVVVVCEGKSRESRSYSCIKNDGKGWRRLNSLPNELPGTSGSVAYITPNGLKLIWLDASQKENAVVGRWQRTDDLKPWGVWEPIKINGETVAVHNVRLTPDNRYMLGQYITTVGSRMVISESTDGGQTFGPLRAIKLPQPMASFFPMYCPNSTELYFEGRKLSGETYTSLYVLRNFDPERDTEPLK